LEVLRELGNLYFFQRKSDKAGEILAKALEGSRHVLGNRHPDTLRNMHMLGAVYENIGRIDEAESLYIEALNACEQVLGPDHEDTIICMCCFGLLRKK